MIANSFLLETTTEDKKLDGSYIISAMGFSMEVIREMFGPETLGLKDFRIMSAGPCCQECGDVPASYTLNFDVLGDAESVPVCDKCGPLVEAKVSQDLASKGRTTVFGRNGWGRG